MRDGHHHAFGNGRVFGVATSSEEGADLVADLPSRHAFADLVHDSGYFKPHPLGPAGGRRVLARALQEVRAVQRRRMDFDHDFARPHGGFPNFCPDKVSCLATNEYGFHD